MQNLFETKTFEIKIDDTLTFTGLYKKRTFWQWLTGQPRELLPFTVKSCSR